MHRSAIRFGLLAVAGLCSRGSVAIAQQAYRNVVNMPFRTVGDGPQSALILDVPNAEDQAAVREAALARYRQLLASRRPSLHAELDFLRRRRIIRPGRPLVVTDAVIVRQNGRLMLPPPNRVTRGPGPGNDITFNIPVGTGQGQWSQQDASYIQGLINLIYPDMKTVLGPPLWTGQVTVLNLDPTLGMTDEVVGAVLVINGTNIQIDFPTFSSFETQFLAMAQVMAQAFHGPARIGYDAWEQGMGRAAAVIVARDLQTQVMQTYNQTVNPANGFFYTPYYDLLNQHALGNNTFFPPTKTSQPFNPVSLAGMLVPRLEMSSTAWLKCYIENPAFFTTFNASYLAAYMADPTIANDVIRLTNLAAQADPTVEGQPFQTWYQQQYVLDTSVTPGPKLYAYTTPTFPSDTTGAGAAAFLVYYQTSPTGDETDLSGTVPVLYWDFQYNQVFFPGFDTAPIQSGFGTVAPIFSGLGTNPDERLAMDFDVNNDYVRVYFPANETGSETTPNDFSGVSIGADAGTLSVTYEGGGTTQTNISQGAFGTVGAAGVVPNGFSRTMLVFTPTGGAAITFQRNTAFNNTFGVAPAFVLYAPAPTETLSHSFAAGPQMISFPFQPVVHDLALLLGLAPGTTLLAQWRMDTSIAPNPDDYQRYPAIPLYQPGYGLWSNFAATVNAANMVGQSTDIQQNISVGLTYGWDQIGTPYSTAAANVTTDLSFTYLGTVAPTLQDAINNGWVGAGIFAFSPTAGYVDITSPSNMTFPMNLIGTWQGYWIRVLVPEGVTLTYSTPTGAARAARLSGATRSARAAAISAPRRRDGWRVPLFLRDEQGNQTGAVFGQDARGSDRFTALDSAAPPPFATTTTLAVRFPHPDWDAGVGSGGGDFLSDIRRLGAASTWSVVVTLPSPDSEYTLTWNGTAGVARNTRLTLIDTTTGASTLMNQVSGYSFHSGLETTRRFRIEAQPGGVGLLLVRNVDAFAPARRGRGPAALTISYEVTAAATVTMDVRSATGRMVRHLGPGGAVVAGVNELVWDLRDDRGAGVPAGVYRLSILARAPDGELARAVAPILVTR